MPDGGQGGGGRPGRELVQGNGGRDVSAEEPGALARWAGPAPQSCLGRCLGCTGEGWVQGLGSQQVAELRNSRCPPPPRPSFLAGFLVHLPCLLFMAEPAPRAGDGGSQRRHLGPSSSFQESCRLRRGWGYFGELGSSLAWRGKVSLPPCQVLQSRSHWRPGPLPAEGLLQSNRLLVASTDPSTGLGAGRTGAAARTQMRAVTVGRGGQGRGCPSHPIAALSQGQAGSG